MKRFVVVVLAGLVLGAGWVSAQPDLAKQLQEMRALIDKNTAEIQELKGRVAEKDRIISNQENKIKALEGQGARIDSIDQKIESIVQVEKATTTPPPRGEFGLLIGGQSGVYHQNAGYLMGGFYDPVIIPKDPWGNRISGEIMATFCREEAPMNVDPTLGGVYDALGVEPNPFRHQEQVNVDVETLSLILGAKYRVETLGQFNPALAKVKPYMAGGLGMYVFAMDLDSNFTVGQVPPAPELRQYGYPAGNADLEWGINFGGGVEYQVTDWLAIGFDGRMNWTTGGHKTDFGTFAGFVSFNF